jgi:hypothetical protein
MTQHEDKLVRSRRRPQTGGQRWHRLTVTFTNTELAEIKTAADREQMAGAAWLGKTGLSAARSHEMPASDAVRKLLAAVIDVGTEARRQGNNLDQAVMQLHAAGQMEPEIGYLLQYALDKVT